MSTRRGTRERRCPNCKVHQANCFCERISPIQLKTRVSVIVHKNESFLPSNTAHLVHKSLANAAEFERGHKDRYLQESFINPSNYQSLYLFPSEDATELTPELLAQYVKPINLIVPDGSWRQARKVHRREPLLEDVPRIKLTLNQKTEYQLRRQKHEFGLCTFEAIAHAIKVIEGGTIFDQLIQNFRIFHEAHLKNRGVFEKEKLKMGYTFVRPASSFHKAKD